MDALQTIGSALGLGLLAGVRLYATVFALGLAVRFGWLELGQQFLDLRIVGQTPVLVVSGVACLVEFLADKVPWVDSIWDSVHTFIRPIGATLLGAAALGSFDPSLRLALALLCGGVALTGHSSKAATRLAANGSPEPFTNIGLSFAEDLIVPAGLWLTMEHPLVALGVVGVFLLLFAWLSPRVYRLVSLSLAALRGLVRSWSGPADGMPTVIPVHPALSDGIRAALSARSSSMNGLQGAARSGSLKNSTGHLRILPDRFEFVARRWFRSRLEAVPFNSLTGVELQRGLFLDRLTLRTAHREHIFDLFKGPRASKSRAFVPQPSHVP